MANNGSLKSTIAVSLTNYLDAGAIVAGASGLTLWQNYLGLSEVHLGWLNFISANCLGAAVGAIIGGFLADKYGRKFIFTYNLLVYMTGVLLIMLSVNFPMLLAGFLVTGISVGVGVPASWTYISESSENNNRGRNICISQMSWGIGPMVILLLGMLFAPGGYLFGWVEQVAQLVIGAGQPEHMVNVFSSRIVFLSLFIVAFIAWNLQRQLQESAEFTKGQSEGAEKKPGVIDNIKVLFSNSIAVKTVCFLATIYLTWNLVASVMGFFQPHIYETAGGVTNEQANWMNFIQWFIIVGVTLITSKLIDKTSHKAIYIFLRTPGCALCVARHRHHRCQRTCRSVGICHPLGCTGWCLASDFLCTMGFRAVPCQVPCRCPGPDVLHRSWLVGPVGTRLHLYLW